MQIDLINARQNKLRNKKVKALGRMWDSKAELNYYLYLLSLQQDGKIKSIELQPKVILQPSFHKFGKLYRAISYTPDFLVEYADGNKEYLDVKGMSTQQGEMRRKMFAYVCDIPLRWIAQSKKYSSTGWIDYDELQNLRREGKKLK